MTILKKMIRTITLILGFGAFITMPTTALAGAIDDAVKRGTLRVGLSTFVPWAFVNKEGKFVGYEVDVATQLANDLGVKVELVPTAWDGIIPALNAGKFDLLIGGMSLTTKRNLSVNFSAPYGGMEYIIVANIKHKDMKIADINSRQYTFTARRGAIPAQLTKQMFGKAKLLQFDDDGVSVQDVANGKADFSVSTGLDGAMKVEEYPNNLVLLEGGKSIKQTPSSIAMRKGDIDTLNVINNWILLKKNEGWLQERSDYWFKTRKWKDQLPK